MSQLAFKQNNTLEFVEVPKSELGTWINKNIHPAQDETTLDFESSGLHVDGMWATSAAKCEPEARISTVAMSWLDSRSNGLMSVAIPFDQGFIGGKKGRYIGNVTKRNPVAGWETLPHVDGCPGKPCRCAPWNFGQQGWTDLALFWRSLKRIDYFNGKYDMWIALAGLRPTEDAPCLPECRGWQHDEECLNAGVDLGDKLGHDVMIWEAIRDPANKVSLEAVSRKFFQTGKDTGMEDGLSRNGIGLTKRYDLVDWPTTGKYAAMDTELTLKGKQRHISMRDAGEIDERDFPIIKREHAKCLVLWKMERRGVAFNVDLCREQAAKMHKEVDSLIEQLPFKNNSNGAAAFFFGPRETGGMGLLPIKLTPGNKPSADAEVIARLTHDANPRVAEVAKLWQHIANMQSVCSKWYDAWPHRAGADGRLRTSFWQFATEDTTRKDNSGGAISGRLSASRVQLQGVPQDWRIPEGVVGIKDLFAVKPDHELWSFDASNAEVRVTAWLTVCHALADVINSGVNIHSANTVNIFGKMLADTWPGGWPDGTPYNVFKRADAPDCTTTDMTKALIDKDGDPVYVLASHPDWKKVRTSMKRGIFGTIYASGVRTLKSQIDADLKDDIPERQIKGFMDALNAAYPEIKRTSKACERKVDVANGGAGFVRLVSGRRRVFGWAEATYKALNSCVQGGVAECMSDLMISVEAKYPGMLLNQVHDDLWLEIPSNMVVEVVPWVREEGKRIFEQAFSKPHNPVAFKFDSQRRV